jgi:hypothetical protein
MDYLKPRLAHGAGCCIEARKLIATLAVVSALSGTRGPQDAVIIERPNIITWHFG